MLLAAHHDVGAGEGDGGLGGGEHLDAEVELRLAFVPEHLEEIVAIVGADGLAEGDDLRRVDRAEIFDRAAADDDVAGQIVLSEEQKHAAPASHRTEGVEAAGERGVLVVAIAIQGRPERETLLGIAVNVDAHVCTHGHLALDGRLQLSQEFFRHARMKREEGGPGVVERFMLPDRRRPGQSGPIASQAIVGRQSWVLVSVIVKLGNDIPGFLGRFGKVDQRQMFVGDDTLVG